MSLRLIPPGGGGSPASVVADANNLPASPVDGQLAMVRVGTWPDTEYVELIYDATNSKWVGTKPQSLIAMTDQTYMGEATAAYSYLQDASSGSATNALGWSTRPIRKAAALLTANLTLQVAAAAIVQPTSTPSACTTQARFFQHDDGDAVTFSSDGSTAVAELNSPIVSPASGAIFYKATGWQNVVKLNTSTAITSSDVTKQNLWPRLYMKVASGTNRGQIIDFDLIYRWVK